LIKQKIHEKGKVREKVVRYRPALNMARIPAENLRRDLEKGVLSAITLTKAKSFYSGPGASDLIKHQEEKIVIRTHRADASRVGELVRNITARARDEQYEKISFQIEQLPGGATNSPAHGPRRYAAKHRSSAASRRLEPAGEPGRSADQPQHGPACRAEAERT
jgi:hypothetical protein